MDIESLNLTVADAEDSIIESDGTTIDLVPVAGTTDAVLARCADADSTTTPCTVTLTRDELQAIIEEQRVLGARYAIDGVVVQHRTEALDTFGHCHGVEKDGKPCVADAFRVATLFDMADDMVAALYGEQGEKLGQFAPHYEQNVRALRSFDDGNIASANAIVPLHEMLYLNEDGSDSGRREAELRALKATRRTLAEFRVEAIRKQVQRAQGNDSVFGLITRMNGEQDALAMASNAAENYRDFVTIMVGAGLATEIEARVGAETFANVMARIDAVNAEIDAMDEAGVDPEAVEAHAMRAADSLAIDPVLGSVSEQIDTLLKAAFRTGKLPEQTPGEKNAQDADTLKDVLASLDAAIPLDPM